MTDKNTDISMKGLNSTGKTESTVPADTDTDAVSMLMKDHREVEEAFAEYEKLSPTDSLEKKKSLTDFISKELLAHMAVEEDVFYPAVKGKVDGAEDVVNEGIVEHASAKEVIEQIKSMQGDEELFDAKVKVLNELIEHHVEEEESEMFPKVRESSLDLDALSREMSSYKAKH